MISIIIPIFNQEDYLHVCLNSLIKQSHENFEVICIDDASTDNTAKILDYFSKKDSRIKIYKNKTKKGEEYCKNKGVEVSTGEKIIFLNANEWLSFDALELLSQETDHTITKNLSNKISDFRKETPNLKHKNEINHYKTSIQKIKDEKTRIQKKLAKFTKPQIINKIINNDYSDLTIAIKSPHPEGTTHWGELFFSTAIKKSFD